jgi:hypothetical protein
MLLMPVVPPKFVPLALPNVEQVPLPPCPLTVRVYDGRLEETVMTLVPVGSVTVPISGEKYAEVASVADHESVAVVEPFEMILAVHVGSGVAVGDGLALPF